MTVVGDNGDVFPDDPDESADSDGDGVGDNADPCPNNAADDTDGDGLCGATYTVCASGCMFTSINSAIDAADDGDIILLSAETYSEGEAVQGRRQGGHPAGHHR